MNSSRLIFVSAAILSTCSFASGENACKSCDKYQYVRVEFTSSHLPEFTAKGIKTGHQFDAWLDDKYRSHEIISETVTKVVSKPEGLVSTLSELASTCKRVAAISIMGHGAPGAIGFGDGSLSTDSTAIYDSLRAVSCVMAPNATISLTSCEAGNGCAGDSLNIQIARALLPRGGAIISSETPIHTTNHKWSEVFMKYPVWSSGGKIKMLAVSDGGRLTWTPAQSTETCREDIKRLRQLNEKVRGRFESLAQLAPCKADKEMFSKGSKVFKNRIDSCEASAQQVLSLNLTSLPATTDEAAKLNNIAKPMRECNSGVEQFGIVDWIGYFAATVGACFTSDPEPNTNTQGVK